MTPLVRALALGALTCCSAACRVPVPATSCEQDLDCPADYRCHLELRFCVTSPTDAGSGDALHVEGGAADAVLGDVLQVDAGAVDSAHGDTLQFDTGAVDAAHGDTLQVDTGAVDAAHGDTLQVDAGVIVDPGCYCGACPHMNGSIALGSNHSCALNGQGQVLCWGRNGVGELGNTGPEVQLAPALVCLVGSDCGVAGALAEISAISAGDGHTCALTQQGRVWCWGKNNNGQLGTGDVQTAWNPAQVCARGTWDPEESLCAGGEPLSGVVGIAAGNTHTCAVIADGSLRCWGSNSLGKLGDGSQVERHNPAAVCERGLWDPSVQSCGLDGVRLLGAQRVSAGQAHTCALLSGGELRCWGSNSEGQLGVGELITSSAHPVSVCILGSASAVSLLCEEYGAEYMDGVIELVAGGFHTCVRKEVGYTWCWGSGNFAQLGDGTNQLDALNPVGVCTSGEDCTYATQLSGATALSAGMYHTCARLQSGELRCWGVNNSAELGDGTLEQAICQNSAGCRPNPVATCAAGSWNVTEKICTGANLGSVAAVAGGLDHSCALLVDGSLRCWGSVRNGMLGNGHMDGTDCDLGKCQLNPVTVCASGSGDTCAGGAALDLGCAPD